jgi:hypothetical protein
VNVGQCEAGGRRADRSGSAGIVWIGWKTDLGDPFLFLSASGNSQNVGFKIGPNFSQIFSIKTEKELNMLLSDMRSIYIYLTEKGELKMDFWHSIDGMSELTQRILARRLRRELLRRNQGLHRALRTIDDRTLLHQWFLQSFLERERISREALSLRARAVRSVHVDGEVVTLLPAESRQVN